MSSYETMGLPTRATTSGSSKFNSNGHGLSKTILNPLTKIIKNEKFT